jgi:hypothetical protein
MLHIGEPQNRDLSILNYGSLASDKTRTQTLCRILSTFSKLIFRISNVNFEHV